MPCDPAVLHSGGDLGLPKSPEKHFLSHPCHLHLSPCHDAEHPCPAHWQWLNSIFKGRVNMEFQTGQELSSASLLISSSRTRARTYKQILAKPYRATELWLMSSAIASPRSPTISHSNWPTSQSNGPDGQDMISEGQPLYCLSWFPTQSNWIQQENFTERPIKYLKGISHQDSITQQRNSEPFTSMHHISAIKFMKKTTFS